MTKGFLVLAITAALAASGCASKKYVNNRIDPLGQRVGTIETASGDMGKDIDELQTQTSRANERAISAGHRADEAGKAAERAGEEAGKAGELARDAKSSADSAHDNLDALEGRVDGLNDYRMASRETILFGFESSQLGDEAREKLDRVARALLLDSPFAIEIRGFTDTTGSKSYNLALSERRAKAVMRYLTTEHKVPLHRIVALGFGSDEPTADNKTRGGREMNRRVEVTVYVADESRLSAAR